jgi:hypothetical protein
MKNTPSLQKAIKKKGERNPRVGRQTKRNATHTIGTSFRHLAPADVSVVQRWYSTGYFSQRELADIFKVSAGIISKCCRCVHVAEISYVSTPRRDKKAS